MTPTEIEDWHERINAIRDLCGTQRFYGENETREQIAERFITILQQIEKLADYPPDVEGVE